MFGSGQGPSLPSGQKIPGLKVGWAFINCGSKVCSSRVRSGPISSKIKITFENDCAFHKKGLTYSHPSLNKSQIKMAFLTWFCAQANYKSKFCIESHLIYKPARVERGKVRHCMACMYWGNHNTNQWILFTKGKLPLDRES